MLNLTRYSPCIFIFFTFYILTSLKSINPSLPHHLPIVFLFRLVPFCYNFKTFWITIVSLRFAVYLFFTLIFLKYFYSVLLVFLNLKSSSSELFVYWFNLILNNFIESHHFARFKLDFLFLFSYGFSCLIVLYQSCFSFYGLYLS